MFYLNFFKFRLAFEEQDQENEPELDEQIVEQQLHNVLTASQKKEMEEKNDMIVAYFFMSVVWTIGSVLKQASREKFSSFFIEKLLGRHHVKYNYI